MSSDHNIDSQQYAVDWAEWMNKQTQKMAESIAKEEDNNILNEIQKAIGGGLGNATIPASLWNQYASPGYTSAAHATQAAHLAQAAQAAQATSALRQKQWLSSLSAALSHNGITVGDEQITDDLIRAFRIATISVMALVKILPEPVRQQFVVAFMTEFYNLEGIKNIDAETLKRLKELTPLVFETVLPEEAKD
jgi:hypothetical protein